MPTFENIEVGERKQMISKNRTLNLANNIISGVFTYSTERSATIKSFRVGIAYRLAQILLLVYIIGYELITNKGYQTFDTVSSVVTTKVKGQGYVPTNLTLNKKDIVDEVEYYERLFALHPNVSYHMLDTADYVIPPNEFNSVFIMSNFLKTDQIRGSCEEEITKYRANCSTDNDCKDIGSYTNAWNGIPTGRCINSTKVEGFKVCEVTSWCPVEHEIHRNEDNLIRNVLNFTILIKNNIEFKKFKKKVRNILPQFNNSYISTCTYDEINDPYCPVFQVNYVLAKAEPDSKEIYHMLIRGGVILIEIIWNCDFDFDSACLPLYSFRRFDAKDTATASGFNFRFASTFLKNDIEYRVLYKAFGLRFIINVSGTAGKFNIIPLMLSAGAGIGLMSFSVIIADCVLLNCTKKKKFYQEIKELDIRASGKNVQTAENLTSHIVRL